MDHHNHITDTHQCLPVCEEASYFLSINSRVLGHQKKAKLHCRYTRDHKVIFQLFCYLLVIYPKAAQYRLSDNWHNIIALSDNNANYMQQAVAYNNINVLAVTPISSPKKILDEGICLLLCDFECVRLCVWSLDDFFIILFQIKHIYKSDSGNDTAVINFSYNIHAHLY